MIPLWPLDSNFTGHCSMPQRIFFWCTNVSRKFSVLPDPVCVHTCILELLTSSDPTAADVWLIVPTLDLKFQLDAENCLDSPGNLTF